MNREWILEEVIKVLADQKTDLGVGEIVEILKQKGIKVGKNNLREKLREGVGDVLMETTGPNGKLFYGLRLSEGSRFHSDGEGKTVEPLEDGQEEKEYR